MRRMAYTTVVRPSQSSFALIVFAVFGHGPRMRTDDNAASCAVPNGAMATARGDRRSRRSRRETASDGALVGRFMESAVLKRRELLSVNVKAMNINLTL